MFMNTELQTAHETWRAAEDKAMALSSKSRTAQRAAALAANVSDSTAAQIAQGKYQQAMAAANSAWEEHRTARKAYISAGGV